MNIICFFLFLTYFLLLLIFFSFLRFIAGDMYERHTVHIYNVECRRLNPSTAHYQTYLPALAPEITGEG